MPRKKTLTSPPPALPDATSPHACLFAQVCSKGVGDCEWDPKGFTLLLCDGEGCEAAYHMVCASVDHASISFSRPSLLGI